MGTATGAATLLGNGIKGLMIKMLAFNAILLAAQLAIAALVQGFAEFQKASQESQTGRRVQREHDSVEHNVQRCKREFY